MHMPSSRRRHRIHAVPCLLDRSAGHRHLEPLSSSRRKEEDACLEPRNDGRRWCDPIVGLFSVAVWSPPLVHVRGYQGMPPQCTHDCHGGPLILDLERGARTLFGCGVVDVWVPCQLLIFEKWSFPVSPGARLGCEIRICLGDSLGTSKSSLERRAVLNYLWYVWPQIY